MYHISQPHPGPDREVSGERETVPGEKVTPPGETLIWLFLQVGLALYLGDMMKTMVGASKKLEDTLAMSATQTH